MTAPHAQCQPVNSDAGFAIFSFGRLDVTTVSPTRRGAVVNWLVTSARRPIYAWTTDGEIEGLWRGLHGPDHECAMVLITRAAEPSDAR